MTQQQATETEQEREARRKRFKRAAELWHLIEPEREDDDDG